MKWSDVCELILHSCDSDTAIQHKILIERTIILRGGSRKRICGTGDPELPLQYRVKGFPGVRDRGCRDDHCVELPKTAASTIQIRGPDAKGPLASPACRQDDTSKQMVDLLFFFDPGQKQLVAVLSGRKNFYVFHDDGDQSFIGVIFQFDKSAYGSEGIQGVFATDFLQQDGALSCF